MNEFEFEDIPITNENERRNVELPNTQKQRRELEDFIYKNKEFRGYLKTLAKCSEILGRNITGVGMMSRSEIDVVLRKLKEGKNKEIR